MEQKIRAEESPEQITKDAKEWVKHNYPTGLEDGNFVLSVYTLLSYPLHNSAISPEDLKGAMGEQWMRHGDRLLLESVEKFKSIGISDEGIRKVVKKAFSYPGVILPIPPKVKEFLEGKS